MERRHDLDAVRVIAFGLLVLYHVGMYYVSWDWHVKSPDAGPAIEPLMLLTAPWRLGLLFLVSGAASAFLLQRRPQGFVGTRSKRLLLPLTFGMLVVVAPQAYFEVVEKLPGGYADDFLAFYLRYLRADAGFCWNGECLILPTWNHLWFVAYLWAYTVTFWLLHRLRPSLMERLGAWSGRALSGVGALLWPFALLGLARVMLIDRFESTHALVDDWYNHAQYLPLFLIGALIARVDAVWANFARLRWAALALAIVSYAAIVTYVQAWSGREPPGVLRTMIRIAWGLNQWTAIVAALGFAWRFRDLDSAALRYLVPAVFPVYILHQTVIVVLAVQARHLDLPPMVEGPLLALATFALCSAGYELARRVGPLRPLFGLAPKRR